LAVFCCQLPTIFGGKERSLIFMANACQVTSDKLHGPVSPQIIVSCTISARVKEAESQIFYENFFIDD